MTMGFSMGRLSPAARAMLRDIPDETMARIGHEVSMAEMTSFWKSLDGDQTLFIAKMLRRVADSDEPATKAGMYYGNAEMMLHLQHGKCICGELHRDTDDLLQELILRADQREAEDQACELFGLRRVGTHGPDGKHIEVFVCLNCGHAYDSIDQRRAAGDPGKCPGCINDNTE